MGRKEKKEREEKKNVQRKDSLYRYTFCMSSLSSLSSHFFVFFSHKSLTMHKWKSVLELRCGYIHIHTYTHTHIRINIICNMCFFFEAKVRQNKKEQRSILLTRDGVYFFTHFIQSFSSLFLSIFLHSPFTHPSLFLLLFLVEVFMTVALSTYYFSFWDIIVYVIIYLRADSRQTNGNRRFLSRRWVWISLLLLKIITIWINPGRTTGNRTVILPNRDIRTTIELH